MSCQIEETINMSTRKIKSDWAILGLMTSVHKGLQGVKGHITSQH